jgi:hypothetical protein
MMCFGILGLEVFMECLGLPKIVVLSYIFLTSYCVLEKIGPRSNKIKQMQKQNTEDTQYKRDTDLCGSPSVGYVH